MSDRIATAPIGAEAATVGDYRSRALMGDQRGHFNNGSEKHPVPAPALPGTPTQPQSSARPAPAVDASATAFAAAIVAGGMPPQPLSALEILLRGGSAWAPPESELHLTDRIA